MECLIRQLPGRDKKNGEVIDRRFLNCTTAGITACLHNPRKRGFFLADELIDGSEYLHCCQGWQQSMFQGFLRQRTSEAGRNRLLSASVFLFTTFLICIDTQLHDLHCLIFKMDKK
jgi:hypothetical protein